MNPRGGNTQAFDSSFFRVNTTDAGRLGEARVIAELTKYGWYPFTDISGKCPVDLLAWKDGKTITLQVKTTASKQTPTSKNYVVQIGCVRPNRTGNVVKKFDPTSCDYLGVYVIPTDTVYFIASMSITTTRMITINDKLMAVIPT